MIKSFIVLSVLAVVLGQEFDISNNVIDYEDTPYQRFPLPYRRHDYGDKRIMNVRSKLIKNPIVGNSGFELIARPTKVIETADVVTSLSTLQTSLMTMLSSALATLATALQSVTQLFSINIPALAFGATLTFVFCNITSLCSKFGSILSFTDALKDFSLFVTPDRLNVVSNIVEMALRNNVS